jgi:hypothetical protein
VYRARAAGSDLEAERYAALAANIMTAEAEIARVEREIETAKAARTAAT